MMSLQSPDGSPLRPLLVRPHELRLRQDVSLHEPEEAVLGHRAEVAQHRVERVELEEVAVATVIRECVDAGLGRGASNRKELWERASRFVGAFSDREGKRDVSRRHDDYLDEAYR